MATKQQSIFRKILGLMKESAYEKRGGKISSGRLSSYFILVIIIGAAITFIGIDIANAIMAIVNKGFYEIPSNHLALYGMTLAHHLALLGINKISETKVEQAIQDKLKTQNQLNPKDISTDVPTEAPGENFGADDISEEG